MTQEPLIWTEPTTRDGFTMAQLVAVGWTQEQLQVAYPELFVILAAAPTAQPVNGPRSPGYIYCMTNPHVPGIIKLGLSVDVDRRRSDLARETSNPGRLMYVEWALPVADMLAAEQALHAAFRDCRLGRSESFKGVTPERAKAEAIRLGFGPKPDPVMEAKLARVAAAEAELAAAKAALGPEPSLLPPEDVALWGRFAQFYSIIDRADVADMHPRGEFRPQLTALIKIATITELEVLHEGLSLMDDKFMADAHDGLDGALTAAIAVTNLQELARQTLATRRREQGIEDYY